MIKKSQYHFFLLFFILLGSTQFITAEVVDFSRTKLSFSIVDTNSDSDTLKVNVENAPTLPQNSKFQISFSDQVLLNFSGVEDIVTSERLIGFARVIEISFVSESDQHVFFERTVEPGVWTHFGHVMISWPFCQGVNCVPDEKGFAVGAKQDIEVLSDLILSLNDNLTHVLEVAEQTINVIHGTEIDFDNNGIGVNPSDGYGLTNYTFNMREHIFNTRAAISNVTSELYDRVNTILGNMDSTIYNDSPINPALENINSSSKLFPSIFQIASEVLENSDTFNQTLVENLTTSLNTLKSIILTSYFDYRDAITSGEFEISDFIITLKDSSSKSNEDNGNFPFMNLLSLLMIIPIIRVIKNKNGFRKP